MKNLIKFFTVLILTIIIVVSSILISRKNRINIYSEILIEISKAKDNLIDSENYYYEAIKTGNNNYTYKVWVKGSEVASFNNTSFYYLNSNKAYQVITDNVTELDDTPYHLKKKYRTSNDPEAWFFNSELYADGFEDKLDNMTITEETYNNIPCHKITYTYTGIVEVSYFDKVTILPIKCIKYSNDEVYEEISYTITFGTVTDEDVTLSQELLNNINTPEVNNPENIVDIEPSIPSEEEIDNNNSNPENIIENTITVE